MLKIASGGQVIDSAFLPLTPTVVLHFMVTRRQYVPWADCSLGAWVIETCVEIQAQVSMTTFLRREN
jgi:hypothetical protein